MIFLSKICNIHLRYKEWNFNFSTKWAVMGSPNGYKYNNFHLHKSDALVINSVCSEYDKKFFEY